MLVKFVIPLNELAVITVMPSEIDEAYSTDVFKKHPFSRFMFSPFLFVTLPVYVPVIWYAL